MQHSAPTSHSATLPAAPPVAPRRRETPPNTITPVTSRPPLTAPPLPHRSGGVSPEPNSVPPVPPSRRNPPGQKYACNHCTWEVRVGSEEGGMTGGRLWRIPEALPERCRCQLPWSGGGIGGRELKLIGAEPGIGTGGRLGKSIREERLNKAQA